MTTSDAIPAYLAHCALCHRGLSDTGAPMTLGQVTLMPHQTAAVRWLLARIRQYGGALLADPPGLGKTYVAIAVAAALRGRPIIVAPAALRSRWLEAARATGVALDFVSVEKLSAPVSPRLPVVTFVIIDEAHHLRTRSTRRYARTAQLCAHAPVLLLTATPIHNRAADLAHLAALFHLPPAFQSATTLRRTLTLRRTPASIHAASMSGSHTLSLPDIVHRKPLSPPARDSAVPAHIAQLPPLTSDASDGHPLVQLGLLHALRSSDAALIARLRHRIAVTLAVEHAAMAGVTPTALLRRAWQSVGGDVQLAMPTLLGEASGPPAFALAARAVAQRLALEAMLRDLRSDEGDCARGRALRRLARWCATPVVAFTQFSATAHALFSQLAHRPGIALLTGEHGRICTGNISRDDVLDRLLSARWRGTHQGVQLLITTDVLSEGLSLAGVATIVHLDLPWTAARLDQRVGRAARIGAPVRTVRVVTLLAPVPTSTHDTLRALLSSKRRAMRHVESETRGAVQTVQRLASLARGGPVGAAQRGWITLHSKHTASALILALVRLRGRRQLVAACKDRLRTPRDDDWLALSSAVAALPARGHIAHLRRLLEEHLADRELETVVAHRNDPRLVARRLADSVLLDGHRAMRTQNAAEVSESRRSIMQRRGFLNDAPTETATDSSHESDAITTAHGERRHSPRRSVVILAGVVILPACD